MLGNEDLPHSVTVTTTRCGVRLRFVRSSVNEDPEIAKSDIYVIPANDGTEKESKPFKVTMGKSDEIEHQILTAAAPAQSSMMTAF